jgi:hypothetical protein
VLISRVSENWIFSSNKTINLTRYIAYTCTSFIPTILINPSAEIKTNCTMSSNMFPQCLGGSCYGLIDSLKEENSDIKTHRFEAIVVQQP